MCFEGRLGAGYGTAVERLPASVLRDVREGSIAVGRAADANGVVLTREADRFEMQRAGYAATADRRLEMASAITD